LLEYLSGDRRSELYNDFWPLLQEAAKCHGRFLNTLGVTPFEYTEQTVVGAFVWAAARRNLLCLNEYQVLKSKKVGKKPKANGRADLWIDFEKRSYSLEFKRAKYMANSTNLRSKIDLAKRDVNVVDPEEHDRACAVLSAYVRDGHRIEKYRVFSNETDIDLAVRIGAEGETDVFLYFVQLR